MQASHNIHHAATAAAIYFFKTLQEAEDWRVHMLSQENSLQDRLKSLTAEVLSLRFNAMLSISYQAISIE